jgi:hypothetical protein
MRLIRLLLVVVLASAFQWSLAQALPEEPGISQERSSLSKSVHIFPNPATEYVHVKLEDLPAEKIKLTLHNIIGNQIEIETEIVDEHELRVKVKDLAAGYYLLALKDDEAKFRGTYKFQKR